MYLLRSYPKDRPQVRLRAARIVSKHDDVVEARTKRDKLTKKRPDRTYTVTNEEGVSCDLFPTAPRVPVFRAIEEIARNKLNLPTLDTRHHDASDFHELAVWQIREALFIAHEMGRTGKQFSEVSDIYAEAVAP